MKHLILYTLLLFTSFLLVSSCKQDRKVDEPTQQTVTSTEEKEKQPVADEMVNDNNKVVEVQEDVQAKGETEAVSILKERIEKSEFKGKSCSDIQKEIDALIAEYKSNPESDAVFEKIDKLGQDGIYLDCLEKKKVKSIEVELIRADSELQ